MTDGPEPCRDCGKPVWFSQSWPYDRCRSCLRTYRRGLKGQLPMHPDLLTIRSADDPIYAVRRLRVAKEFEKLALSLAQMGFTRETIDEGVEAFLAERKSKRVLGVGE